MRRRAAYAATDTTHPDQSRKPDSDLSQHIQRLDVRRLLSREWLKVHTSLELVTSLALLQHKPFKDGDPHTTLWEGNEVAVRLILETGRLNVLLRCCVVAGVELKQYNTETPMSSLRAAAIECGLPNAEAALAAGLTYVKNLGSLFHVMLSHVEAVQTVDLPLLVRHVSQVLRAAVHQPAVCATLHGTQEHFALPYLWRVAQRFEQVGEDKVMPLLAAEGTIPLAISFLHAYHFRLTKEVQMAGCLFLAAAFDAEDALKLPPASSAELREFMPLFMQQMDLGAAERRQLRPLLDEFRRAGG